MKTTFSSPSEVVGQQTKEGSGVLPPLKGQQPQAANCAAAIKKLVISNEKLNSLHQTHQFPYS
jgi:hypothetical protein